MPLIALLLAAFGSVAWAKPKVAILGLEVINSGAVDPKDAGNASKLTEELRRNPGSRFELAPNSNRELQDEKVMGSCDTEKPSCMAPIGSGLNADFLVYGRIEKAKEQGKDGYKILIKLLSVKDRKVEESWDGFVAVAQIGGSSLRDWSQKVNARLAGEKPPLIPDRVEKGPGKLLVKIGNTKTGKVSIDGAKKGELDDGTITLSLSAGAHRLEIEAPDRKPYEDTVIITSGQTQRVDIDLEETLGGPPPPPPPGGGSPVWRKVMWGSVVGGLAAGGVWYAGYGRIKDTNKLLCNGNANGCSEASELTPGIPESRRIELTARGDKWEVITFTMGGLVAVAGTLTIIGAWKGYFSKSSGESQQTSAVGRRTRRELTVTPVISPDGGGATVRFDW